MFYEKSHKGDSIHRGHAEVHLQFESETLINPEGHFVCPFNRKAVHGANKDKISACKILTERKRRCTQL